MGGRGRAGRRDRPTTAGRIGARDRLRRLDPVAGRYRCCARSQSSTAGSRSRATLPRWPTSAIAGFSRATRRRGDVQRREVPDLGDHRGVPRPGPETNVVAGARGGLDHTVELVAMRDREIEGQVGVRLRDGADHPGTAGRTGLVGEGECESADSEGLVAGPSQHLVEAALRRRVDLCFRCSAKLVPSHPIGLAGDDAEDHLAQRNRNTRRIRRPLRVATARLGNRRLVAEVGEGADQRGAKDRDGRVFAGAGDPADPREDGSEPRVAMPAPGRPPTRLAAVENVQLETVSSDARPELRIGAIRNALHQVQHIGDRGGSGEAERPRSSRTPSWSMASSPEKAARTAASGSGSVRGSVVAALPGVENDGAAARKDHARLAVDDEGARRRPAGDAGDHRDVPPQRRLGRVVGAELRLHEVDRRDAGIAAAALEPHQRDSGLQRKVAGDAPSGFPPRPRRRARGRPRPCCRRRSP